MVIERQSTVTHLPRDVARGDGHLLASRVICTWCMSAAAAEPATVPSAAPPETAYLLMSCASCRVANEVAIPAAGVERGFVVQCHTCRLHSHMMIDTAGEPLLVAEGLAEWAQRPPSPPIKQPAAPKAAASVPPKKRKKLSASPETEVLEATIVAADEDGSSSTTATSAASKRAPKTTTLSPKAKKARAPATSNILVRPAIVRHGSVVLALFHDGYYYTGVVQGMKVRDATSDQPVEPVPTPAYIRTRRP